MEERKDEFTLKQIYIQLFVRVKNIILSPSTEWKKILNENLDLNQILSIYILPLIGICTLTSFISYLINLQEINFELALKYALITFTSLFGGIYLSYLIIGRILHYFQIIATKSIIFSIIAYSSTPLLLITILVSIVPELVLLYLASFYAYYIIWQGIKSFPGMKPDSALTISIIITFIIHFLPFFVQRLLLKLFFI